MGNICNVALVNNVGTYGILLRYSIVGNNGSMLCSSTEEHNGNVVPDNIEVHICSIFCSSIVGNIHILAHNSIVGNICNISSSNHRMDDHMVVLRPHMHHLDHQHIVPLACQVHLQVRPLDIGLDIGFRLVLLNMVHQLGIDLVLCLQQFDLFGLEVIVAFVVVVATLMIGGYCLDIGLDTLVALSAHMYTQL